MDDSVLKEAKENIPYYRKVDEYVLNEAKERNCREMDDFVIKEAKEKITRGRGRRISTQVSIHVAASHKAPQHQTLISQIQIVGPNTILA